MTMAANYPVLQVRTVLTKSNCSEIAGQRFYRRLHDRDVSPPSYNALGKAKAYLREINPLGGSYSTVAIFK